MKESVNDNEFILYTKFVTGPSSTQLTFFMETRNASRPNRTITWLALLPLCLKVYLRKRCSFSTHPCFTR